MKKIAIVIALASVLFESLAQAETSGKSYLALDLGTASYSGVNVPAGTYPNPGMYSIAYGYHATDTLGVEVGYTKFGDSIITTGVATGTESAASLYGAVVGSYPLNPAFALIGKAGLSNNSNQLTVTSGGTSAQASAVAMSLYYSIGANFNISSQFSLRAQYENFGSFGQFGATGNNMSATAITLGGIYNF